MNTTKSVRAVGSSQLCRRGGWQGGSGGTHLSVAGLKEDHGGPWAVVGVKQRHARAGYGVPHTKWQGAYLFFGQTEP